MKRRTLLASLAAAPLAYLAVGAGAVGIKATELDWGLGRRVLFLTDLHIHGEWHEALRLFPQLSTSNEEESLECLE